MGGITPVKIPYKPRKKPTGEPLALRIHNSDARYITLIAHRRFGKSVLLFNHIQRAALMKKGRYAIVGPYHKQVKSIYWTGGIIDRFAPHSLIKQKNKSDLSIEYINGSIFEFIGSENYDAHRGSQYDYLGIDEADDHHPLAWSSVFRYTIVSQSDGSFSGGRVIFAGTGKGEGFLWENFNRTGPNRQSFIFRASDTGLLSQEDIDEIRQECEGNDSLMRQELECIPMYFSGLIYKEFGDHNIIEPFHVPLHWETVYGFDHGANNPTAFGVYRIDQEGNIYKTGEYYMPGKRVIDHVPEIKKLMRTPGPIVADPSIFNNTQQGALKADLTKPILHSIVDEYGDHDVKGFVPGNNEVLAGINRMGEYLRFDPERIHPLTGQKGSPKFFIFKGMCPYFEKEIKMYRWREKREGFNDPDAPVKRDDHAMDETRYVIMSRPMGPEVEKKHPTEAERVQRMIKMEAIWEDDGAFNEWAQS